jgi:hypothetical protein
MLRKDRVVEGVPIIRMVYIVFSYSFMALIAFQVGPSAPPLHAMLRDTLLSRFSYKPACWPHRLSFGGAISDETVSL